MDLSRDGLGLYNRVNDDERIVAANHIQNGYPRQRTFDEIHSNSSTPAARGFSPRVGPPRRFPFFSQDPDGVDADSVVPVEIVSKAEDEDLQSGVFSGRGFGRRTVNTLPAPGSLVTSIRPLCARTIFLAIESPSPEPVASFRPLRLTW